MTKSTKKAKATNNAPIVKISDLKWAVESRYKNQNCALDLYELLKKHEDKNKWAKGSNSFIARSLVGVAFSLWRAAFLADKADGQKKESRRKARAFLEKVIQTNAIAFSDDRTHKEWTYDYYIENAYFRLLFLYEKELIAQKPKSPRIKSAKDEWKQLWQDYQDCLSEAVKEFEKRLESTEIRNPSN